MKEPSNSMKKIISTNGAGTIEHPHAKKKEKKSGRKCYGFYWSLLKMNHRLQSDMWNIKFLKLNILKNLGEHVFDNTFLI